MNSKFHRFSKSIEGIELPKQFTYPFHYVPHQLCVMAADEVRQYVQSRSDWADELHRGKMLGVLVAKDGDGNVGFLAAFSGNLAHSNNHDYFVPPVYDLLAPDGEFRIGEAEISAINAEISRLESGDDLCGCRAELRDAEDSAESKIEQMKADIKVRKEARLKRRAEGNLSADDETAMTRESQHDKAELKRLKKSVDEKLTQLRDALAQKIAEIDQLKMLRKQKSMALQKRLFSLFVVRNARGESEDLIEIFRPTQQGVPPAGAGECAAPKLMQYAYVCGYQPVCMAEFWWGDSPVTEVRHHGHYYPACRSKCLPILTFMLQGLDVEPNPLESNHHSDDDIEVVHDDQWLVVVNKPSGMLTVPGKLSVDSLLTRLQRIYPEASGPMVVHRLDQSTSGLVMVAKNKEVHKSLQSMFADRRIEKQYVAILDGIVANDEGMVDLPLRPDHYDRPRQMVDFDNGKPAHTQYRVLERKDGITRILFMPHTGRTHQLRVHASHPQGLNAPIVGDMLYGKAAQRLMLHAMMLRFEHPVTHEMVELSVKPDF